MKSMNSLFSESAIETIKKVKKIFLWIAVCILIGEVVLGAILILVQNFNETIGRLMGTFATCAVMMFFGVNNFSRMEKGDRIIQSFALVSLIGNIIWLLLSFLFIWNIVPYTESSGFLYYRMTGLAKVFSVAVDVAFMCFLVSNVWSIKETLKPVKPLKITAIVCALYCGIYSAVVTVGDVRSVNDARWYALAGLAGLAFLIMTIAASVVSKSGLKKNEKEANAGVGNVNDAEMQAKIQEMVEKEVQERLQAEKDKAGLDAMPPLQSEDMSPSINHDNNMEIDESDGVSSSEGESNNDSADASSNGGGSNPLM